METPGPASVPPHPVEHPQWAGMNLQRRAVDGGEHSTGIGSRRVEAMAEGRRRDAEIVGLRADRDGRRLVAGANVAAAGLGLLGRRLAADRLDRGDRAARLGNGHRVDTRGVAAAVRRCVGHGRRVNGGDARSQGRDDGRGTVVTTPGAGTAGTRGQEGGDDQGRSEGEP